MDWNTVRKTQDWPNVDQSQSLQQPESTKKYSYKPDAKYDLFHSDFFMGVLVVRIVVRNRLLPMLFLYLHMLVSATAVKRIAIHPVTVGKDA